ncbi:MAG: hypothetical protein NTV31_05525 [Bacteroidia bacterium]|nr:hypothetical protein [Bacteroidia bacterium]
MHILKEKLPVAMEAPGTKMRLQMGLGGMAVAYNEMPPMDSAPMLKGLPNDSCPCPHWGYMLKGSMNLRYDDGTEETVKAGEVFYLPAGHNASSDKKIAWIEFSPEKELKEVFDHLGKK